MGQRKNPADDNTTMGIEIIEEDETQQSADIFNKLELRKDRVPMSPLTEGKLE
jgi:hypothetical protein